MIRVLPARRRRRLHKCTCRFLWNYELHALTQFVRAPNWQSRLFWGALITICFGTAIFTTYTTFSDYLERQTATLITKQKSKALPKVIREIRKKIPHLPPLEAGNLIAFAIAGAGFHNMEPVITTFTSLHQQRLYAHLLRWKGDRTYKQFYNDLFIRFGYRCEDLFHSCYVGYEKFDCCERFQHQYVMLRGKCFRLQDFVQTEPDIFGKLLLLIRVLPSPLVEKRGLQPQIVVFISDNFTDISTFPRFYISVNESRHVRFWMTEYQMLPYNTQCSTEMKDRGRAMCFMEKYHTSRALVPFNCSLFYLSHRYPNYKICNPLVVVYNYNIITNAALSAEGPICMPACHRRTIRFKFYKTDIFALVSSEDRGRRINWELLVCLQYEVYKEIPTTTLPGFISELGGQSGLFLGFSVISLLNVVVSVPTFLWKRWCERAERRRAAVAAVTYS
ncbi:hypothetical protein M3Y99_01810000 [Aphelenchoides fujianensis]|nr:hypothetical protein M3Y99_01810000 [Aphelenchoides fujianensis]